ncbi:hypothetical protein AAVH_33275, partial [Aphelenchoides avenae]
MWLHLRRTHKDADHSAVESGPYGSVNVPSPPVRSPKVKSPNSEARKPTVYSKEQLELLEGAYAESQYIEGEARSELAMRWACRRRRVGHCMPETVQCWFRCRRYKEAQLLKKNTEANGERAVHARMALVPVDAGTPRGATRITWKPDLESVHILEDLDEASVEPCLPSQTPETAFEPKAVITASPSRNDRDSLFSPVGEVGQSLLVATSSEPANDYGESDEGLDVALEPKDAVEPSSLVAVQPSENATRSLSAFTSPFASSQQHGAFEALALPLPQPSPVYAAAPPTTPSDDLVDAT